MLKLLSLFDGIGGFPLAYARATGQDHKLLEYASSEIEPFPLRVLENNFPNVTQIGDIRTANFDGLNPDIITMGTPCTGFSVSGMRDGLLNVQSKLFIDGIEVIKKLQPKYFIWENVFGVLSAQKGNTFKDILQFISDAGYDAAWTMLDTQYFGIPQRRRRIYMIGFRDGFNPSIPLFKLNERMGKNLPFYEGSGDGNPSSEVPEDYKAYFNIQRSDKHIMKGVASTFTKRDYKQFTDIVVQNGQIRKLMPEDRLRLQGIPDDFFYNVEGSTTEMYQANGMSVPVVEWVFDRLFEYDDMINNPRENNSPDVYLISTKDKIDGNGCMIKNSGGHCIYTRTGVSNMPDKPKKGDIWDFLDPVVPVKYQLSEKACAGVIKRHRKGGNLIPIKLFQAMVARYPKLAEVTHEKI